MGHLNGTVSSAGVDSAFGRLVEDLTARIQAGDAVDWLAVAHDHPEYVGELNAVRPALEMLGQLSRSGNAALSGIATALTEDDSLTGILGDFRLLRKVGRGGMGVVYEAEQISLGRRVALKVLPYAGAMDAKHLQRFKNEAKAAASLKHDHIVQVHAVGCERGVHFYAMEFIEGQTLADLIAERETKNLTPRPPFPKREGGERPWNLSPLPASGRGVGGLGFPAPTAPIAAFSTQRGRPNKREFHRRAAELIANAADALEHAHSLGIVHRDIKPGNLLLDGDGKIYVADFGLARFGPDAGLTVSGDPLGTLRYMAPEQAMAKHSLVDHRADIYSLGATLYELLTGYPAVDGEDKQEILNRIAFCEPTSPRKLDRAIPAELDTITLKCLAKEPAERYSTAGELAADLRRFLDDRPVKAKPPSAGQRLRKWTSRHRTFVAMSGLLLVVLSATLTAGSIALWREKEQTGAALRQAEANFDKAREIVEDMYAGVAQRWLEDEPEMGKLQRDYLQKALGSYEGFAKDEGRGRASILDRARAYRRVGDIEVRLGRHDAGEAALTHAIDLQESRPSRLPEEDEELAAAYDSRGRSLTSRNRQEGAERDFRRALSLPKSLTSQPVGPEQKYKIASYQCNLAAALARSDRPAGDIIAVLQPSP